MTFQRKLIQELKKNPCISEHPQALNWTKQKLGKSASSTYGHTVKDFGVLMFVRSFTSSDLNPWKDIPVTEVIQDINLAGQNMACSTTLNTLYIN